MRLYLSSYRIGNHADKLLELAGSGRKVAIIENALDHIPHENRDKNKREVYDVAEVFQNLDFETHNLDLRHYFDGEKNIEADLKKFDLIWSCGGNAFLLRRAMQQSGFDKAIKNLLIEDELVYGGWSAGICVLGKTLQGLELCDDPDLLANGYNPPVIWDGLNITDYSIAPHYKSDHPEALMIEKVVEHFKEENISHITLRDGDVITYNGDKPLLLKLEDGASAAMNARKSFSPKGKLSL